ncbi:MAG: murein transglycosylase [Proteobacteria bacterium]|nr:murein transglycosylase [Pseudomonadota bacterium]
MRRLSRLVRHLLPLALLLWCASCGLFKEPDRFGAQPIGYDQLNGWEYDRHADALEVFVRSCVLLEQKPKAKTSGSGIAVPRDVWRSLCREARSIMPGEDTLAREFFERRFAPYRVNNNGREQGLFTGYYEPMLYGSKKKKGDYQYPVYAAPDDLMKRRPYYSHAEINKGVLKHRGLELFYVDDPVMLFFMQIQGSGRVLLPGGEQVLLGYAGQNGHEYVSLGKIMGDEGYLPKDQINFFTLRQWLYDHPDDARAMMERNPSYVFFKALNQNGPVGAVGSVLVPQRSLAVDAKYIPYGLPLFLETQLPTHSGVSAPFNRIMIAQDTGGAIRGPVRGDIFFGPGEGAEYLAGFMKGRGVYTLLVPREIESQIVIR